MIVLENIKKVFQINQLETAALQNLTLEISSGEFLTIMGPSGCGKSTLLNIIGALDYPSSGFYHFNSHLVSRMSPQERTSFRRGRIGYIFQDFNLVEDLTVEENVALPLEYLNISRGEKRARSRRILDRLGIIHLAHLFPFHLSSGQQQKVTIARAIVFDPEVILADEPTGSLDSKNGDEIIALLQELNEDGKTVVMVSHSPYYAEFGTRIAHMLDGQITFSKKLK